MDTSNPWNQLTAFLYNDLIDELLYVISAPCSPEPDRYLVPADSWLQRDKDMCFSFLSLTQLRQIRTFSEKQTYLLTWVFVQPWSGTRSVALEVWTLLLLANCYIKWPGWSLFTLCQFPQKYCLKAFTKKFNPVVQTGSKFHLFQVEPDYNRNQTLTK